MNEKIPTMRGNPERQRLQWLYVSGGLLALVIGLYVLSIWSIWSMKKLETWHSFSENIADVGFVGYLLSCFALEILMSRSFKDDIQSRFWDQLRMSSLSAWQMTWPRLWIAPMVAWLGIIIGLGCVLLGGTHSIFLLISLALFAVILASWLLINNLQMQRHKTEWHGAVVQVFFLIILLALWWNQRVFSGFPDNEIQAAHAMGIVSEAFYNSATIRDKVNWWFCGLIAIVTILSVVSAWRMMAYRLHLRPINCYWLCCGLALPWILNFYTAIYFIAPQVILNMGVFKVCLAIYGTIALISLTVQNSRWHELQKGWQLCRAGQYLKAIETVPLWVIFLPLTSLLIVLYSSMYLYLLLYLWIYAICVWLTTRFSKRFSVPTIAMFIFGVIWWTFLI